VSLCVFRAPLHAAQVTRQTFLLRCRLRRRDEPIVPIVQAGLACQAIRSRSCTSCGMDGHGRITHRLCLTARRIKRWAFRTKATGQQHTAAGGIVDNTTAASGSVARTMLKKSTFQYYLVNSKILCFLTLCVSPALSPSMFVLHSPM
jgi:hypothetical protein